MDTIDRQARDAAATAYANAEVAKQWALMAMKRIEALEKQLAAMKPPQEQPK